MKTNYSNEDNANLKLVIGLARASKLVRSHESKVILDAGITMSQFGVLEALYHKGDLRISELIEKNLSTGGNMTVVVNNLIKDGYVRKFKDEYDKRSYLVTLTPKGYDVINDLFPKHLDNIRSLMSHLTITEKNSISELLKKFCGI